MVADNEDEGCRFLFLEAGTSCYVYWRYTGLVIPQDTFSIRPGSVKLTTVCSWRSRWSKKFNGRSRCWRCLYRRMQVELIDITYAMNIILLYHMIYLKEKCTKFIQLHIIIIHVEYPSCYLYLYEHNFIHENAIFCMLKEASFIWSLFVLFYLTSKKTLTQKYW